MNFGIDYDGTIADTNAMKVVWIKNRLGIEVPAWKTDRTSCVPLIGLDDYNRMSDEVYERELTLKAPEVPGAIRALGELSKAGKLYIVTARLPHRLQFCREWLQAKGALQYFSGIYTSAKVNGHQRTKEQICRDEQLEVLIDDDERHLAGINLPGLRRILIKNGSTEQPQLAAGIEYTRSWDDVLKLVAK